MNDLQIDHFKLLGEWALGAGRLLQSKQTGYIHYYYGESQGLCHTIPLVENALFVLSLLRSRMVEQAQEAKMILKGLLAFQDRSSGNFPIYLHEYPECRDYTMGLQLLAPFYWILHHFGHILGAPLKIQLEQASRLALEYSLNSHQITPYPFTFAIRLASAQYAYGGLWNLPDMKKEGMEELDQLSERQLDGWTATKHLGELLIGLQMVYPSLINSPWKELWHRMEETWDPHTGCYVGPCIREWQEGVEPQVNIYDLFGGYFSGQFSRRASILKPCHLYGSLIQSKDCLFHSSSVIISNLKEQVWKTNISPERALILMEKKEANNPSIDKTFTPFRMLWGNLTFVHSLVCQGGKYEKLRFSENESTVHLIFDLSDHAAFEQREIEFFLDLHPGVHFLINGETSNTFEMGQKILISMENQNVSLSFNLLEGEGHFLGHIMRGNRPSQIENKNEKCFQVYDWTIFLRTIRRVSSCKIGVSITINER